MRQPVCPQNPDTLLAELEDLEALFREHPLDAARANIPLLRDVVLADAVKDSTTPPVKSHDTYPWHQQDAYPFTPPIDALASQEFTTETIEATTKNRHPDSDLPPPLNYEGWVLLPAELAVLAEDVAQIQYDALEEDMEQMLSELVEEIIPIIKTRLRRKLRAHLKLKTTV